jgi:LEA14-like dessication related protein
MKGLLSLALILLLLGSCTFYEPEFRGGESLNIEEIDGKDIHLRAGGKVYNPNGYAIKVKPSTLDIYVNDEYIGKVHLDEKVKMKAKQETLLEAPLTATLADGAMFRLMRLAGAENVTVRMSGKVKAAVWFISKKVDVNESRTMDGINLKLPN